LKLKQAFAIKCQQWIRMKNFRKALRHLIEERRQQEFEKKRLECAIKCQKALRMKLFRKYLNKARVERENLIRVTIICQKSIRMKIFRTHLRIEKVKRIQYEASLLKSTCFIQRLYRNMLFKRTLSKRIERKRLENSSASKIQRTWRMYKFRKQMNLYRSSAIKIQKWFKYDMKDRIAYLKLRRGTIFLQKIIKLRFQEKKRAAILIQKTWRMYLCRKQFKAKINAALILQKWWRHLKEHRIRFLKLKRSMPVVEAKLHALIKKRNHAASVIQRVYRMYKFRREMKKYRNAALKIQTWTRSMSQRYLFLRSKYAIYRIQMLYRNVYMPKRHAAAKVIQKNIRKFLARKRQAKQRELVYLNQQATRIQACWRGYKIRKNSNLNLRFDNILNEIRNRLSLCGERLSGGQMLTLGARIRTAINTLSHPCEIGRIIVALQDLDKVTRLSPECCFTFIREGAHEYLYSFISTCNRSIPHMDLVKYCLRVSVFF
jgi:abnormal spindle-like microcephaly-associated protein